MGQNRMAGNPGYPQLLKPAGPTGPALLEHTMNKYSQGWRELNEPANDDHKLLHVLWVGPLLWLILWLAMALF